MRSQGLVSSCSRRVGPWEGPRGVGCGCRHPPPHSLLFVWYLVRANVPLVKTTTSQVGRILLLFTAT